MFKTNFKSKSVESLEVKDDSRMIFAANYFFDVIWATGHLGKLQGAELKIAKLKLAPSGASLAHIMASLKAVAKTAVMDFF